MTSRFFLLFALTVVVNGCANKPTIVVHEAMEANGILEVVSGEVSVKSGETGQVTPAVLNQKINPKDTIITGPNARTKVVMADKNELHVAPGSQVEIKNYELNKKGKTNVLINLLSGKVRANVRQKYDGKDKTFQIQTKTAVAGVRGTEFLASLEDEKSKIVSFEGVVEFGLPGADGGIDSPVAISPGETSSNEAGKVPSAPEKLPPEKLAELDQESKVETGTPESETKTSEPVSTAATTAPAKLVEPPNSVDAQVALLWLKHGNQRFVSHHLRADGASKKDISRLAKDQTPHSMIFTCSDSRISPEIIFDQKLGEIVVIRTASLNPDQAAMASIELALKQSRPRLLLVLENNSCAHPQVIEKLKVGSALIGQSVEKGELLLQTAHYGLKTGVVKFEK